MLQRVHVEVHGAGGSESGHGDVGSAAPAPLAVERGLVLAPEVLQRLLPDVAIVVKGAMQSAGSDIKTEQPPLSNQLLLSDKQDKQPSASEQPPQHKPKQEKVKQPNLESCQRWNMFPCNLCTLPFPSRPTLNEHWLNHEAFKSFDIRKRERRAKKQYMCKFCPQVFPIKELRQLHMKIHVQNKSDRRKNQEKLYFCNNCEKYFSLFELSAHKKRTACFLKDTLMPNQSCHVCSKEFEDTFDLTLHLRTHGAPLKSYSVRKPKPNSCAKLHTDTDLSSSISARTLKPAESVNATKAQQDRELKESYSDPNQETIGSVNATNVHVHKDRNLGDSFSAQNPKPHKDTQLGGSHSVCNPIDTGLVNATKAHKYMELGESSRNPMPTGFIVVNDPKTHKDLKGSVSAQKPKLTDSIYATKTHKRVLNDNFHTCNTVANTYTRSKLPKLTNTVTCPTTNNGTTMTKLMTVKEVFRDNLNERKNVEAANLQISNVSEVQSKEKAELTNVSTVDSNKNIMPFGYNCLDNMFAIKEAFREKSDKGVNTVDSNGSYEDHEIKEGKVLSPELLEQLRIDLNEVSAMNNNNEYVLPDAGNRSITQEMTYDTGIQSEVNKRNTTVIKEEPEVVFGENVSEYGDDVSNTVVKKEPQELNDKEKMMKAVESDSEIMINTKLLSLCKAEVENESALGLLLHESLDVAFQVSHKDTAAENEQNIETVIAKESAEFTKNISMESKDLVNAALEAAWKELYAEHEAMELALVKIEKDPEIIDKTDLTDIVNKKDTVKVKDEVEVLEDTNRTDVVVYVKHECDSDGLCVKQECDSDGLCVKQECDSDGLCVKQECDSDGLCVKQECDSDGLCVKQECDSDGLCVKQECDSDGLCVKQECDSDGFCVKQECDSDGLCVKQECDSDGCGDNEAALVALYEDHVVKQELVLGPELLQKPSVVYTPPGQARLLAAKKTESSITNKRKAPVEEKKEKPNEKIAETNSAKKKPGTSVASQDWSSSTDVQEATPAMPASSSSSEVNTLTAETDFKRQKCGKGFNIKSDLEKHFNTYMLMEASTSHKVYKFMCKTCNCTFDTKLLLQEHEKSRHGVKYFACDECDYATKNAGNLQAHLRTHTGEKPFKCSQCSSVFTTSSNLRVHFRIHTGEKPFKCSQCSSAFSRSSDLRVHLRTHSAEKPFECNICDYKTTRSGHLKNHLMSRHSGQKPFGCDACSYRGATRGNVTRHMKRHHKPA